MPTGLGALLVMLALIRRSYYVEKQMRLKDFLILVRVT